MTVKKCVLHVMLVNWPGARSGDAEDDADRCCYFITSTLDTGLFSQIPVTAPEMLVAFLRAITENEAIHEPWIVPQAHGIPLEHFTQEYSGCLLYFRREGGD